MSAPGLHANDAAPPLPPDWRYERHENGSEVRGINEDMATRWRVTYQEAQHEALLLHEQPELPEAQVARLRRRGWVAISQPSGGWRLRRPGTPLEAGINIPAWALQKVADRLSANPDATNADLKDIASRNQDGADSASQPLRAESAKLPLPKALLPMHLSEED